MVWCWAEVAFTTENNGALCPWECTTGWQQAACIFPRHQNSAMCRVKLTWVWWVSAAWVNKGKFFRSQLFLFQSKNHWHFIHVCSTSRVPNICIHKSCHTIILQTCLNHQQLKEDSGQRQQGPEVTADERQIHRCYWSPSVVKTWRTKRRILVRYEVLRGHRWLAGEPWHVGNHELYFLQHK